MQNAFLHGTLHEIIYMHLPPGHRRQGENIVCRLNKSLCGLKQASRTWFSTFSHVIKSVGFQQSKTGYSLFTRQNNSSFTALLIYVDDILLTGNDLIEIQRVKDCLWQQFRIKDLGDLKYFLGIEFSRSKAGIYISQRKYDILQDTGLTGARPDKFPIKQYLKPTPDDGELLIDPVKYRRLVGRHIPHGYSAWHSIFGLDPKSIYTGSTETSLGCRNSSPKLHQRITRTRIFIAIQKQSDIDSLLRLRLGRLSDNSEISIWVLHFSWFFYYLMEVKKANKRIKIISGSRIPRDGQYLFGDSLVAISVAGFKGAMKLASSTFLWQSSGITYSSKPSISWTHKTHWDRRSHFARKITSWDRPTQYQLADIFTKALDKERFWRYDTSWGFMIFTYQLEGEY